MTSTTDQTVDQNTGQTVPMAPPHAEARSKAKFTAIRLAMTPGIDGASNVSGSEDDTPAFIAFRAFLAECLTRHHQGDCGDMDEHDKAANAAALIDGSRIFSSYAIPDTLRADSPDPKVWIITEAVDMDEPGTSPAYRDLTTILFPSEY